MAQSLVVPLDGSELAENAMFWADALATSLDGEVTFLGVVPPDTVSESLGAEIALSHNLSVSDASNGDGDAGSMRIRRMQGALERERSLRPWRSPVRVVVLQGDPAVEIADYADRSGSTLIVMATHARGGPLRVLLGSVTGEVINRSNVPVLVIRPGLPGPAHSPSRVLVPLDGSELSEAILLVVIPLAQELGWSVVLFSVAELPPATVSVQGAAIPLGHVPAVPPAQIVDHLDHAAAQLHAAGVQVETRVASGHHPADAIMQAVAETDADLIAMSTHGRRGLNRWVRGSVTDAVLHHAEVPVLVVRPKHDFGAGPVAPAGEG